MRRNGTGTLLSGTAVSASILVLLVGCSLLPQPVNDSSRDEDASDASEFKARDLEDLFDPDDAPNGFSFELDYSVQDASDWIDEVAGYWDDASGSEEDCYDSYRASLLVSGDDNGDNVAIARNDNEGDEYASVDARVFDDAEAAQDFLDDVADAAEECSDAGGYNLSGDGGAVYWEVSEVSVEEADDLDLPDGVTAIIQEEDVDSDFADSYRVIMLQRGNVVVAVTIEPFDGGFDAGDGDKLAELVAEELADLD